MLLDAEVKEQYGDLKHSVAGGGAIECNDFHVHVKYINPEQVLLPVMSDPGTPADSFGASGIFKAENEPQLIEKEYDVKQEDLTVIWDYLYESYRNGKPFPIKEEVLRMMKAITCLFEKNELHDFSAHRDALA